MISPYQTPSKRTITLLKQRLLERPALFSGKKTLGILRNYTPGKDEITDLALWNIHIKIEKDEEIETAIKTLEDALTCKIITKEQLKQRIHAEKKKAKKQSGYWPGVEKIKEIVEEEGAINSYDLAARCGNNRDIERTTKQAKDAGMKIVDMDKLISTLKMKRRTNAISKLEQTFRSRCTPTLKTAAMSPEYYKMITEGMEN